MADDPGASSPDPSHGSQDSESPPDVYYIIQLNRGRGGTCVSVIGSYGTRAEAVAACPKSWSNGETKHWETCDYYIACNDEQIELRY